MAKKPGAPQAEPPPGSDERRNRCTEEAKTGPGGKSTAAGRKAPVPSTRFDERSFLEHCVLDGKQLTELELDWRELAAIYHDHEKRREMLEATGSYIVNAVRRLPEVHSVRMRIKSPVHLVKKIVRKAAEAPLCRLALTTTGQR